MVTNIDHNWFPGERMLAGVPGLYATEDIPTSDKILHLHYFIGACDWYIAELDQDQRLAFGYVNLGDPNNAEWGYIDLNELEAIRLGPFIVERDLYWTPRPASAVLR